MRGLWTSTDVFKRDEAAQQVAIGESPAKKKQQVKVSSAEDATVTDFAERLFRTSSQAIDGYGHEEGLPMSPGRATARQEVAAGSVRQDSRLGRTGQGLCGFRECDGRPPPDISDIHKRVGGEIHPKQVKRALEDLIERGDVRKAPVSPTLNPTSSP